MLRFLSLLLLLLPDLSLRAQCFVSVSNTQPASCGLCNGKVEVTFSGGIPPYAVNFNGLPYGSITGAPLLITNVCAGPFGISVTDGTNALCTGLLNGIVASTNVSGFITTQNAGCGLNNGQASLSVTGGQSPYTYLWSNGAVTQNLSALAPGIYTVTITDAGGCTFVTSATVGTNGTGVPSMPGTISGSKLGLCAGTSKSYSVATVTGATSYAWAVPAGASIVSGAGTQAVVLAFSNSFNGGAISVAGVNACGNGPVKSATLRSAPLTPGVISGPTKNLCGSIVNYSIAPSTTGATSYTWTVPASASILSGQGTTGIQVQWPSVALSSATLSVVANNACGSSPARTLAYISTKPAKAASIIGPATICAGQPGVSYSLPINEPGVSYAWTAPGGAIVLSGQGTSAIVMNWGSTAGTVMVIPSNSCGTAATTGKSVSINCRTSEADRTSSVRLLPNPSKGNAVLQLPTHAGMYTVTVHDMIGHLLLRENSNTSHYAIGLSNASAGLYHVAVRFADGTRETMRMIIEK